MIKEITNYYGKARDEENYALMQNAYDEAHEICEYANDMMTAGRIEDLPVRHFKKVYFNLFLWLILFLWKDDIEITGQGLLLRKEETQCYKR